MESFLVWDKAAANRFPSLFVCTGTIRGVRVENDNEQSEALRREIIQEVRRKYRLELLKVDPIIRAYRDLFWSLGVDPTKTRPSGEALLRRVLHGDEVPRISTVVDAYNLASVKTIIPLSGFDLDDLSPPLTVRFSEEGEDFHGIGMDKTITLVEKMLVVADKRRIVCIYPHRDADETRITEKTNNVLILGYGAPGVIQSQLVYVVQTALDFIRQTAEGTIGTVSVFKPS